MHTVYCKKKVIFMNIQIFVLDFGIDTFVLSIILVCPSYY
jgi:hypothetical protein